MGLRRGQANVTGLESVWSPGCTTDCISGAIGSADYGRTHPLKSRADAGISGAICRPLLQSVVPSVDHCCSRADESASRLHQVWSRRSCQGNVTGWTLLFPCDETLGELGFIHLVLIYVYFPWLDNGASFCDPSALRAHCCLGDSSLPREPTVAWEIRRCLVSPLLLGRFVAMGAERSRFEVSACSMFRNPDVPVKLSQSKL